MAELLATPTPDPALACAGTTLARLDLGRLTWLAPYPGRDDALSQALQAAHGLAFPAPGMVAQAPEARALWSGRAQALLEGPAPDPSLAAHAALLDHSDALAGFTLTGPEAADTLARLCPLDLRPLAFPPGRTAKSLLGHMTAQITPTETGFEILVPRSMAATAAHELSRALRAVAARPT